MSSADRFVTLVEMAPRDGLQNEPRPVSMADKVRLVDALSDCGFLRIEVTSFVDPRRVPQMGDAAEVMAAIRRRPGVSYGALTPNLRGYTAAVAAHADEVAVFASASETFSHRNINCSIAESLVRFRAVAGAAHADGMPMRGYVSCVTDCPYEGPTPPAKVAEVATSLAALGCREISLGDTIGHGTPESVERMLAAVLAMLPSTILAGHFHDTRGHAIDNIDVCLERGLRTFDAAAGGLGGCPFAPGAKGNVATESVVDHLAARGFETGIDRERLEVAAGIARELRGAS